MTEEQIMQWMREKVKIDGFSDPATLAEGFLSTHHLDKAIEADFEKTLEAGFKIAQEVHGF